jgi:hypothetical protein
LLLVPACSTCQLVDVIPSNIRPVQDVLRVLREDCVGHVGEDGRLQIPELRPDVGVAVRPDVAVRGLAEVDPGHADHDHLNQPRLVVVVELYGHVVAHLPDALDGEG